MQPTITPKRQDWDYIIVGGGSAGCVLAARLSANPAVRVLLLEAGGPPDNPLIDDPGRWPELFGTADIYPDRTVAQPGIGTRALFAPHGRVIGGSGTINAMIHHRPASDDIDDWALDSWRWADLAPMFAASETYYNGPAPGRGESGPVAVRKLASPSPLADVTLATANRLGLGTLDDINGPICIGAAVNQIAFDGRHRQHGGRAYLGLARDRSNLTVVTGAVATALIMAGQRCVGVNHLVAGEKQEARGDTVLLCGGALRSPQLLMLSGIGPADHLRGHGIEVVADVPAIGENLHDHLLVSGNNFATDESVAGQAEHGSVAVVYAASGLAGDRRDMLLNVSTSAIVFPPLESQPNGFKTSFSFTRPRSRGSVTLASGDAATPPTIDPGYLTDPHDVEGTIAALSLSRKLLGAGEFARFGGRELNRDWFADSASIRRFLIAAATPFGHYCGTVRMGDAEADPLDQSLAVKGLDGLRVVDASVLPSIPSSPTNALVIAIAELAAARLIAG